MMDWQRRLLLALGALACAGAFHTHAGVGVPKIPRRAGSVTNRRMMMGMPSDGLSGLVGFTPADFEVTTAVGSVSTLPSTIIIAAGQLSNVEVILYFGFLSTLIGVPFVLGTRDNINRDKRRDDRGNFIEAINGELGALYEDGDEESLRVAKELEEKLASFQLEIRQEEKAFYETRWFGAGRFFMPAEYADGQPPAFQSFMRNPFESSSPSSSSGGARPSGGRASPSPPPEEKPAGNRYAKRQQKKLKRKKGSM